MSQATFITDLTIGELEANFALYCKALRILVLEEKPINQFGEAPSAAGRQSTHQHATDFGQEVIPAVLESGLSLQSYLFDGYWEGIGTIKAFFDANLALADEKLAFSFYDERTPIDTLSRYLPPSCIRQSLMRRPVLGESCILNRCVVEHCVFGLGLRVEDGVVLKDTLALGADGYESESERPVASICRNATWD